MGSQPVPLLTIDVGIGEGDLYVLLVPVLLLGRTLTSELPPISNNHTPAAPPKKTNNVNAVRMTIKGRLDFFTFG